MKSSYPWWVEIKSVWLVWTVISAVSKFLNPHCDPNLFRLFFFIDYYSRSIVPSFLFSFYMVIMKLKYKFLFSARIWPRQKESSFMASSSVLFSLFFYFTWSILFLQCKLENLPFLDFWWALRSPTGCRDSSFCQGILRSRQFSSHLQSNMLLGSETQAPTGLGAVVYMCNSRYSGDGDWEPRHSRPVLAKISRARGLNS